ILVAGRVHGIVVLVGEIVVLQPVAVEVKGEPLPESAYVGAHPPRAEVHNAGQPLLHWHTPARVHGARSTGEEPLHAGQMQATGPLFGGLEFGWVLLPPVAPLK